MLKLQMNTHNLINIRAQLKTQKAVSPKDAFLSKQSQRSRHACMSLHEKKKDFRANPISQLQSKSSLKTGAWLNSELVANISNDQ